MRFTNLVTVGKITQKRRDSPHYCEKNMLRVPKSRLLVEQENAVRGIVACVYFAEKASDIAALA